METNTTDHQHQPVLLQAVLDYLAPKPGDRLLDLTAGYGGHAAAILDLIGSSGKAVLIDRDEEAVATLQRRLGADKRVAITHQSFGEAASELTANGQQFDMVLIDLGVSSPQLDQAERGFSFRQSAELDMRMDRRQALTASEVVNDWNEAELASIIRQYGEEPYAKRIAAAVVAARPITSTTELSGIIGQTIRRKGKINPATRTFQAIRMAVNDELGQLETALDHLDELLSPGGRVAIISFHSLEDRLVKNFFKEFSKGYEAKFELLTKKPVQGSTEDEFNPRARSAKMRAAAKIKT